MVYRRSLTVKPYTLTGDFKPTSFEMQLATFSSTSSETVVVNIYRSPSSSRAEFLDELAELVYNIGAATSAKLLICGDMNCPGYDEHSTDVNLSDLFDSFGLKQHVTAGTREDNLLDVLSTEDHAAVMGVSVEDVGLVSDHQLVFAKLQGRPHHAERPDTPIATSVR